MLNAVNIAAFCKTAYFVGLQYDHLFLWTLFQVGNIKANFYNICMSCPEKRT